MPGFNIPFSSPCNDSITVQGRDLTSKRPTDRSSGIFPSNEVETARAHRFKLSIYFSYANALLPSVNFGAVPVNTIIDFFPKKVTRPDTEIDEITIHNGQDEIFRPGKQHHQPVEAEFYEIIGPNGNKDSPELTSPENATARGLFDWWRNKTLRYDQSLIAPPSILNNRVEIAQVDGVGQDVWNYLLYRCWPQKVTYSSLDYAESAICTTTVRLRYDKVDERRTGTRNP